MDRHNPLSPGGVTFERIATRLVSRLEQRLGPLPQFGRNILTEGAIATGISIVGTILGWIVILVIVSLGSSSGNSSSTSGSSSGSSSIAAAVALAIASANTLPMHMSVSAGSSFLSGGVDIAIHSPPTLLTVFVLIAGAIGGYRAGQKCGTGWPSGLGVAFVYATIVTIIVAVFSSRAQFTNVGSNSSVSYGLGLVLPSAWFYAFLWPLVPALLGAAGGREAALAFYRAHMTHPLFEAWRPPVIGALWALGVSLAGCLIASFIALLVAMSTNSVAPDAGWKAVGVFVLFSPVTTVYTFMLGLGASLGLSSDPSELLANTKDSVSLLGNWPLSSWAYILPVIVLAGCVIGALKALSLAPRRSSAYKMLLPFSVLTLICAWLSGMSATVRADDSLAGWIRTAGEWLNLGSLADTIGAAAISGITLGFGASLFEALVGSLVLMTIAAALACYLWEPLTQSSLVPSTPNPPRRYGGPEPFPSHSPAGSTSQFHPSLDPTIPMEQRQGSQTDAWQPTVPNVPAASASPRQRTATRTNGQWIALSSVSAPPSTDSQRHSLQHNVCPQCGRVSTDKVTCAACNAPLDGE